MRLKKTPTRIGGHEYIIESAQINADRFQMTESFSRRQAEKEDGLSITQCLHIYMLAMLCLRFFHKNSGYSVSDTGKNCP